jgi:hypothetical protein
MNDDRDASYLESLMDFGEPAETTARKGRDAQPLQFTFDGQGSADPPRMLIKHLVPSDGICFLGGQSGAAKTFVEVNMATCLTSGVDFFGRKVKERVGCAILAAEGAGGLQRRIDAAKQALGLSDPLPIAWRAVNENLLDSKSLRQTIEALKTLAQQFRDEHGVRLGAIFVDTIGAAFGLEDENDAAKVNAAMRVLRQIGDAIGAVVIPVHHYGKAASTGLRGSSAFRGAADAVLSVLAERDELMGKSDNRSLCLAKARDGEEGPIGAFKLEFVHLGIDEDGERFGSCAVELVEAQPKKAPGGPKLTKGARIALTALHEAIGECGEIPPASNHIPAGVKAVTISQWRDYAYRSGLCSSDEPRAKRMAFQRASEALVAAKSIAIWEPHAWPTA